MTKHNHQELLQTHQAEKGSAFFYIFLAVVLFGTLSFTVSRGMRGQQVNVMTDRKADLIAAEVLDYAQKVRHAVDRLRQQGCSETEFNFNPPATSYYTNPNVPADGSCDVFDTSGGSILVQDVFDQIGAIDQPLTGWAAGPGNWYITASAIAITGVGPTNTQRADLAMWTWYVNDKVCMAINDILGITNTNGAPPKDTSFGFGGGGYSGVINVAYNARMVNTTANEMDGKEAGCFFDNDGTGERNYFYQVLIAE